MLKEVELSDPEKMEILRILVGSRGYQDKSRLAAEVNELIFTTL